MKNERKKDIPKLISYDSLRAESVFQNKENIMWTTEKIRELCVDFCNKCGVKFNSPVVINGRLTRTLGRCFYNCNGDVWNPSKIEISRRLLETAADESIIDVIAHECAHYVTCAITHEDHGHDATFRSYCEKIGTFNNMAVNNNIQSIVPNENIYKYTLYCAKCGKFLGGKHRACNITKYPKSYHSNCCGADIKIIQNW